MTIAASSTTRHKEPPPVPLWAVRRVASAAAGTSQPGHVTARGLANQTGLSVGLVRRCLATLRQQPTTEKSSSAEHDEKGTAS